jgi:hypothetical protein
MNITNSNKKWVLVAFKMNNWLTALKGVLADEDILF